MAQDEELYWDESEDSNRFWGPMHPWRSLGQLHASEAIEPLMSVLHHYPNTAWTTTELPKVLPKLARKRFPHSLSI